jgi:hypothetical protein
METSILFKEVQQFTKKSVRDFIKVLTGIILLTVVISIVFQNGRMTDFNLILTILLSVLVLSSIVLGSKLIMLIRADGIYVRFPPWQPFFSKYYWTNISEVYVRDYEAMREFFGWGLRFAPRSMGYIVAGKTGVQIVLKNGNKILITTQRPEEVNELLRKIGRL